MDMVSNIDRDGQKPSDEQFERETQEQLWHQAIGWMEARPTSCADLIARLEDVMAHPND